ncbi:DUF5707 domain-containing protein [Streptomyces pratensis]|uniref:DUF5707 domain-containing protein n=1 Tax=Streptomyces pratensis TaxID=1169025 RepID=UPI0030175D00
MSKRVLLPSLIGVAVVGAVTAGGLAMASPATEPTVKNVQTRYAAPASSRAGSLTFSAEVHDDSGVRGLKVLVWPASAELDPTAAEMRDVESARCHSIADGTARCVYTLRVSAEEAAELDRGAWYISALATATDGDTVFLRHAATLDPAR